MKTTLANHFNKGKFWIDDFHTIPIFQCPILSDEDQTTINRLKTEQYFFKTFKTNLPYGLNIALEIYKTNHPIILVSPIPTNSKLAAKIIRDYYKELQQYHTETFLQEIVNAYSWNKNLKNILISSKNK